MKYRWVDYNAEYAPIVELWIDSEARRYTGCGDGFYQFFEYWKNDSNTVVGENFWGKVIFEGDIPFAVIAMGLYEGLFLVSEYIVDPSRRGQGYGSSALIELLTFGEEIIGHKIILAEAVIYPSNIPSQKAFQKAGFTFDHAHPDGDAWYYSFKKVMPCFCGHDCSRCVTYLATVRNNDELRKQSQLFYKNEFDLDIPLSEIHCKGGRSDDIFKLCPECPWMICCLERKIDVCSDCPVYPCKPLAKYQAKYVNKCNQL